MPARSRLIGALALLSVIFPGVPAMSDPAVLTPEEQIASLDWLTGHWKGGSFEAIYAPPAGGMVLSLSRQYDNTGRVIFFEFERINIEQGVVVLCPYPGGEQSPSTFPLVTCEPSACRVTFANPGHDWPTHFVYESPSSDTLHIRLSGPESAESDAQRVLDFWLTRIADSPLVPGVQ